MNNRDVQVKKEHYRFSNYVSYKRWVSFYSQVFEGLDTEGKDILYIGVGDKTVVNILKSFGKNVTTFDFDSNLKPDICGSITDIDEILTKKYDTIICCQVLEHIPFDLFESTLKKLSKCFNERLILSLPNNDRWLKINLVLPKINIQAKKRCKKLFQKKWDINKQGFKEHYWEIDIKGKEYSKKNIDNIIGKYFKIKKSFVSYENTYHDFYILEKNNK